MVTLKSIAEYIISDEDSDDSLLENGIEISCTNEAECDSEQLTYIEAKLKKVPRTCIKNYVSEVVPKYSNKEFIKYFRVSRAVFNFVANLFNESSVYKNLQTNGRVKSAEFHILLFLWYAGHECESFNEVGDRFDSSISTVHVILKRVIYFIGSLSKDFIVWPDAMQQEKIEQHYRLEKGFPGIIGCVDGTHIAIDPPANGKDEYINRKGDMSLHMQATCDHIKRFTNVFIGYPGSVHDARVLENSDLYNKFPSFSEDHYILGDSAYGCTQHLITPYRDNGHLTAAQKFFNMVHSSCRISIEHTFGILKQRFCQLYFCKLHSVKYLCHFIRACCVLHNISDVEDLQYFCELNAEDTEEANHEELEYSKDSNLGKQLRDKICSQLQKKNKHKK